MPNISLIAAIQTENNGIGYNNNLLYAFKEDLKRFKKLTIGKPVLMGRKTFESIGKPLPDRPNIVISVSGGGLDKNLTLRKDIIWVPTIYEAMRQANRYDINNEIMVIGGAQIYKQFLPFANKQYLTIIKGNKKADAFYPKWEETEWMEEDPEKDSFNYDTEFLGKKGEVKEKIFFLYKTLIRKPFSQV